MGVTMYKLSLITIVLIYLMSLPLLSQQTINYNNNPAAGYVRATWYNSPAFFLVDNNGFHKYENDNIQLQNYLKYLGKNRWIQVVGQTYYVYDENLNKIDSIKNPYTQSLSRMIDWHDVIKLSNGHYLLLLYDTKFMDLSKIVDGGAEDANVIGNLLVETDRTGTIYWEWSTFDHFEITDLVDFYDLTMNIIDFTHINSLQETSDGNIVMSVRNFDEVVKINKSTGEIIWRIGGSESKNNQYTFINDTRNGFTGFSHQHSAQILPNGNLILLDNGWLNPLQQTRAVEYQLDHTNKKATKVWEYYHPNGVFAGTMGSVEVLPNGNRFINFGRKYITEVRPDGSVAWELEYFDGNGLYHATRVVEYMDAVYKNIGSSGSYSFINSDYNTGVELYINSIQGQGDVSVEKHRYLPQLRKFEDTTFTELLPYRYVINQYGINNFNGKIKFNVTSIPELQFPNKARLYWREKEGSGDFREIECTFNQSENVLEAQINKFGEFVIGILNLPKPTTIYPNESVSTPIYVDFVWQKVSGAKHYQVQIAKDKNMIDILLDTTIISNNILYKNFDYNTTYYWQVRAINDKETSQWSNVNSFTTIISSPVLSYPINQSYGIKFYDHLRWNKVEGADGYKVELSLSQNFMNIAHFFVGITDTFVIIPPLKNNTRYYWRVFAIKGRDTVPTNKPFSFVTIMQTPFPLIPSNNEINVSLKDKLEWSYVDGAESYLIQLSKDEFFEQTSMIIDSSKTTSIPIAMLDNESDYYWKVRAVRNSDSSQWSEVFTFRTELTIPKLLYPRDKSENVEINPILRWKENPSQVNYQIQISRTSDFTGIILDSALDVTYFSIRELKSNTTFYWRVKAIKDKYNSSWSSTNTFKTGDNYIIQEPILLQPKHNSTSDFPIKFMWSPINNALKYRIQISKNSSFTEFIKDATILSPEFIFETNNPLEYYYWRVKAHTTYDSSTWSNVWMVKAYNPYKKISLISPKNGELQVLTKDTLVWEPIIGADYYILDIATDTEFSEIVMESVKIQTNKFVFDNLTKGKKYFWRVKCSIKDKENVWSNVWSFTIETPNTINSPNNVYPTNNFVGFYVDGQLEWGKIPDARYYRLAIAKDSLFDEMVVFIVTSNNNFTLRNKLEYSEKYYWRVAALSELANSKWSNVFTFTTELEAPKIQYPIDFQTKLEPITEFRWNEVKDYTFFTLQISKDKQFNELAYSINNIKNNKIELKLETQQTYYARIKSNNYENFSRWSEPIVFSTGDNINSISENGNKKILLYPNPFTSTLNIESMDNNTEINLYDMQGNKIEVVNNQKQINTSKLTPGLYFLKIGDILQKLIKE